MRKNILKRGVVTFALLLTALTAQDKVDAIEAARQAKAAAEKATAAAEAATDAAINQAASQAADNARAKMKQGKLDKEARIAAEIAAAEEAELDAAASAAAEDAKRKMAQELGLEYESPVSEEDSAEVVQDTLVTEAEEIVAKEKLGLDIGFTSSVGFVNGSYITNTPVGGSLVLNTPYGFSLGNSLDFNVSIAAGFYKSEAEYEGVTEDLNALFIGLGVNATLFEMIFSETHVGLIGQGLGVRNFSGVSLEKILKKGLNLPINILVGGEGFLAMKADDRSENATYWGGLGVRLDYSF